MPAAAQPLGRLDKSPPTGVTVQCGESGLGVRITNHEPPATRHIATGGRLLGEIDGAQQHLVRDLAGEVKTTAHCPRRTQQGVDLFQVELHADVSLIVPCSLPLPCARTLLACAVGHLPESGRQYPSKMGGLAPYICS